MFVEVARSLFAEAKIRWVENTRSGDIQSIVVAVVEATCQLGFPRNRLAVEIVGRAVEVVEQVGPKHRQTMNSHFVVADDFVVVPLPLYST